jgi:hypothetical protein
VKNGLQSVTRFGWAMIVIFALFHALRDLRRLASTEIKVAVTNVHRPLELTLLGRIR